MPIEAVIEDDRPILISGVPKPVNGITLKFPSSVTIN
jgi:hypothetical protein